MLFRLDNESLVVFSAFRLCLAAPAMHELITYATRLLPYLVTGM